ncbi:C40 family peptidase [Mycobacteroides abscessus subsp. abscessus]|uniref:C40 family peptidase n=1 Tax=Mycobacteroides abscessus TaxID=36809 RepID=UPI0039F10D77
MTLDLVVQRVGAALGRGHALFSPSPLEVGSSLAASGQSLENVGQRVGAQAQMLDARGAFGREFGAAAGRLGGRIAATGGADQLLGGAMAGAAGDDAAGRNQSGSVVNAAAGDTARTGPYANTPAGQQALLMALRDRVDDQRKVIAAYRARDAQYAAKIRALAYQQRGGGGMGGGMGQAFSGLGQQMRPGGGSSGGGGGGGLSGLGGLGGLFKNAGNTNSAAPGTAGLGALGMADDGSNGLGGPAAKAALSKQGTPYVWGAKGPRFFDCSGLTKWAWGQVGVPLGDDTYAQIRQGTPIQQGQVRAGDLIFPLTSFGADGKPGPGHVMMAISSTQVVHAPQTGDVVKISPMPAGYVARRPR